MMNSKSPTKLEDIDNYAQIHGMVDSLIPAHGLSYLLSFFLLDVYQFRLHAKLLSLLDTLS